MFGKKWLLIPAFSVSLIGCFHDEELRKELFTVNTRVLALETELQDKQQINSRQYVSASSRVGQMEQDLQKMKGEIDRLELGVQKGELPGTRDTDPSIAKDIAAIAEKLKNFDPEKYSKFDERILALEKTQNEILALLEKIDKKRSEKPASKIKLSTLKGVEEAFHKKQFKEIVENAPELLSNKHHAKDADMLKYYYAESLFRTGNMKESAIAFGELIKKESIASFAPKIRLRLGDCFRNLGDKKTAIAYYKLLLEKFPSASESETAKQHIKKLQEHL